MMPPEDTKLEATIREEIDLNLKVAGWVVQDEKRINFYESLGVAVREMDTTTTTASSMPNAKSSTKATPSAKRSRS